jgi:hypothetical protein
MKKQEVPQDNENMLKGTEEIQYATDENGNYTQIFSKGWDIKNDILREAWNEVDENAKIALQKVISGEKSPIYFYMIKNIMDYKLLSQYAETFVFRVKNHCKPKFFKKLSNGKLQIYAEIFEISIEDLINPKTVESSIEKHTKN